MKTKRTTTLTDSTGNPTIVTYPGHVSFKTFNKAHLQEWNTDPIEKEREADMRYEYYIPHKTKNWKRVDGETKGAKKFTTMSWD